MHCTHSVFFLRILEWNFSGKWVVPSISMMEIVSDSQIDDFTKHLGGNRYARVYADVKDAVELLCKYADMEKQ